MNRVHFLVPDCIDDPARITGGNYYDRRLRDELRQVGWTVCERTVPLSGPLRESMTPLAQALDDVDSGELVLVDGLLVARDPIPVRRASARRPLIVLAHMPFGSDQLGADTPERPEAVRAALESAGAIIATSRWTRSQLLTAVPLPSDRVTVAWPGVDRVPVETVEDHAHRRADGRPRLLIVGAVTEGKGVDLAVAALTRLAGLPWHCRIVGSVEREPAFAAGVRRSIEAAGLADRIELSGSRTGSALAALYRQADLLVVASRVEAYGMVVTEALSYGVPVLAPAIGGIAEALGHSADGAVPGVIVPPNDPSALAAALRGWLRDPDQRMRLRMAVDGRRPSLPTWAGTAARVGAVLTRTAAAVAA
jgi:glycosyltransferase involved in cell wall biosynthesis